MGFAISHKINSGSCLVSCMILCNCSHGDKPHPFTTEYQWGEGRGPHVWSLCEVWLATWANTSSQIKWVNHVIFSSHILLLCTPVWESFHKPNRCCLSPPPPKPGWLIPLKNYPRMPCLYSFWNPMHLSTEFLHSLGAPMSSCKELVLANIKQ